MKPTLVFGQSLVHDFLPAETDLLEVVIADSGAMVVGLWFCDLVIPSTRNAR